MILIQGMMFTSALDRNDKDQGVLKWSYRCEKNLSLDISLGLPYIHPATPTTSQ